MPYSTALIIGHWLVVVPSFEGGHFDGVNALGTVPAMRQLTWIFQVMPLFFIVGGYANAASLASHRRFGGGAVTWLLDRGARLVRPTTTLLVVIATGAVIARLLGADPDLTRLAVWVASMPLWFL